MSDDTSSERGQTDYTGADAGAEDMGTHSEFSVTGPATPAGESGSSDVEAQSFSPAHDSPIEGHASQTGRIDVADSGMGTGVHAGTGTISRDQSEGMRDAQPDSNLQDPVEPGGARGYNTQAGGEPVDRGALPPQQDEDLA